MNYYLFITELPIKFEVIAPLSNHGVIIPYDSKCPDINTYGYYPEDLGDEGKQVLKKAVPDATLTTSPVSLAEIQKQASKIQETNEIKQGDLVYHRDYKKLPLLVTYTDGATATIFHNLRTRPLSVTCSVEMLRLADEHHDLPVYKVDKPSKNFSEKVYLDCDIFNPTHIDDYYRQIFLTTLRLRMTYLSCSIVLVNPIKQTNDIPSLLGFESVYGSLLTLVAKAQPKILVSNSSLVSHPHRCLKQNQLADPRYIIDPHTDTQMHLYGLTNSRRHIDEDLLRIKNGQQPLPQLDIAIDLDTTLVTTPATPPKQRNSLKAKLRAIELDAFTTRLDDLTYFLTGFATCEN